MAYSVNSHPFPVFAQWIHEQSSQSGRNGGYEWAGQHGLSLTKADLPIATAEYQICQHQKLTLSPNMAPFSWVTSHNLLVN